MEKERGKSASSHWRLTFLSGVVGEGERLYLDTPTRKCKIDVVLISGPSTLAIIVRGKNTQT